MFASALRAGPSRLHRAIIEASIKRPEPVPAVQTMDKRKTRKSAAQGAGDEECKLPDIRADLPRLQTSGSQLRPLSAQTPLEGVDVADVDLSGQKARNVAFTEVRLTRVALRETDLPDFALSDVAFENCDMANAGWRRADLERVRIDGSRLVGFQCNEARLENVLIRDSNLQLAQIRFGHVKRVRFERCDLRKADFFSTEMENVVFDDCDLSETDFSLSKLAKVDIRTSRIEGVRLQREVFQSVSVTPIQAVQLASVFGLVVHYD